MNKQTVSIVLPTRNNIEYVKLAYNSIRKYCGMEHEIIILDDDSIDGTKEYFKTTTEIDNNLVYWFNDTDSQLGHTITYNIGAKLAKNEIFTIFHADMIASPNYIDNMLKHVKKGIVVSATRIEPPLHPADNAKIQKEFGNYPNEFKEQLFVDYCNESSIINEDKITTGIFAPWMMYVSDFISIGGHDDLFAPFPYEDSDIFQRFLLSGYKLIQSRDSFVYHFTCRGHRWTDGVGIDTNNFKMYESNARRNYLRKWGSWIENDNYSMPIIPKIYNITYIIDGIVDENTMYNFIYQIEPFCKKMYIKNNTAINKYIYDEQTNTKYNLNDKFIGYKDKMDINSIVDDDVVVKFNINEFLGNANNNFKIILQIPKIIESTNEIGNFKYDIFSVKINNISDKSRSLIKTGAMLNEKDISNNITL